VASATKGEVMAGRGKTTNQSSSELSVNKLLTTRLIGRSTWLTVVKAAAAAALAWLAASSISNNTDAVLAPVLAMGVVRSSVYSTLAQGAQTVASNVVGVALALLLVDVAGINGLVVFIATFLALALARWLPFNSDAQTQVPFVVLFVVLLEPTSHGYGIWRLADCVIGSVIGILVALAVPERAQIGPAKEAIREWTELLSKTLVRIGHSLDRSPTEPLAADEQHTFATTDTELLRVQEATVVSALIAADESVRFNPRARQKRRAVANLTDIVEWHQRISLQVGAIALGVDELYDRPAPAPRLHRDVAAALIGDLAGLLDSDPSGSWRMQQANRLSRRVTSALDDVMRGGPDVAQVLESVSLLGRVDQLRGELVGDVLEVPDGQ
jgi:Aromatic acid exporter family member 1